jgi:hypothetical protein
VNVPEHPPVLLTTPPEAVFVSERVQWSIVIPVALLAGIISVAVVNLIAVLSQVLGVLSIALVGAVAVLYYARKRQLSVSTSTGLKIGLVAGFFAFLAHGTLALIQFTSNRELLIQEIRKAMDQTAGAANPQARQLLERMLTPEGIIYFIILSMLVMMVLFVGLGSIGGALAASMTRRQKMPGN